MWRKLRNSLPYHLSLVLWLITLALWVTLLFFNPYVAVTEFTRSNLAMLVVAIFGIVASLYKSPIGLVAMAMFALLPIGIYLLGSPGIFFFIGVCNVCALGIALRLLIRRPKNQAVSKI